MQLNYWKASWPLQPDVCPCDIHFVEYLRAKGVQDKVIYTLTPRTLPSFDLITLFHLCEYYDGGSFRYTKLGDAGLVDLFLNKLSPSGRVLFYKGSSHFAECRRIIDNFVEQARMAQVDEYKSLLAYSRAGAEQPAGAPASRRPQ